MFFFVAAAAVPSAVTSAVFCSYIICLGLLLPAWAFTGLDAAALSAVCIGFSCYHVTSQPDVA
jgi:hypothetical protein